MKYQDPCSRPLCPPTECRCDVCRRKEPCCGRTACGCQQGRGFLLPRIIACGREWLRRCQATLQVEGLPDCIQPPLMLAAVCAAGEPTWTQKPDPARRAICLHVIIPVLCEVRDCQGCAFCGRSCIEVDVTMPLSIPFAECWRNCVKIVPCVRLISTPCTVCEPCFEVQLEVMVEAYMLRWEACMAGQPKPECPPSPPLYPQPCCERNG